MPQRIPRQTKGAFARVDRGSNRKLYDLALWKRLRRVVITEEPLCVICKRVGKIEQSVVVDHITPHKGDWHRFTDRGNLQGLCKACHDAKTWSETLGKK